MKLLPDTSIWVEYLRGGDSRVARELDEHLDRGTVMVCGPVIAELFAGVASQHREELWLAIGSLPWAEIDQPAWRRVGEVANELRSRGEAVPLTDVAIAVATAEAEAELWTRDEDFERIRGAVPELQLRAT